ncbi:MAG: hypothetical protein RL212_601 [Pseudomonadota bacterium]
MTKNTIPLYPVYGMDNTHRDDGNFAYPDCTHECSAYAKRENLEKMWIHKDAYGNILKDGDTISLNENLKVKFLSIVIKVGSKIKGFGLIDGSYFIACKVNGQSRSLNLKFMKKQTS